MSKMKEFDIDIHQAKSWAKWWVEWAQENGLLYAPRYNYYDHGYSIHLELEEETVFFWA